MKDDKLPALFWAKVNRNGPVPELRPDLGPCWEWTGRRHPLGYGQFGRLYLGKHCAAAHRRHWLAVNGSIPDGLDLDHLCRNRACVRLEHLEMVTHAENCRRGLNGVLRSPSPTCIAGHLYAEHGYQARGQRVCRECCRLKMRARRGSTLPPPQARTHCPQGHAHDAVGGHGERACSTCMREQKRAYYDRQRASRPAGLVEFVERVTPEGELR